MNLELIKMTDHTLNEVSAELEKAADLKVVFDSSNDNFYNLSMRSKIVSFEKNLDYVKYLQSLHIPIIFSRLTKYER